ncbi:MAG: hypothetical protein PUC16_01085 [Bacteroidales bacterium]|nr:hypothetical protein [Bacteroidales bacterium]
MNSRFFLIAILIYLSVQVLGQDVVPRQAPIDNTSSIEDSMKNYKDDNPEITKIPIIIDSTEGWEWIDNEKAEDVFETYPLRMDYKKYSSHPQYRVVDKYYDLKEPNLINVVYNSDGKLVRVINIFDSNKRSISPRVIGELLRQTYINDYKTNKYNFKKENQNAQNYVKQELKLIKSSRFYWSKEGVGYLQQLEFDHADDFDILLKIERLNDTSFKLIFGDVNGNSVSTWKVAYLPNGQFKSKIIVTRLPLEKIKVRMKVYEIRNGKLTIHED